ncbi:hypothetical protein B0J18DRAFT_156285 [Chaetomium sp. MPI-SDFR-AT-0129]|nr:hypothetical protein B0J18DRAFT_156285 [Chaetomium sp. MPI-SDFR-AT-0129]
MVVVVLTMVATTCAPQVVLTIAPPPLPPPPLSCSSHSSFYSPSLSFASFRRFRSPGPQALSIFASREPFYVFALENFQTQLITPMVPASATFRGVTVGRGRSSLESLNIHQSTWGGGEASYPVFELFLPRCISFSRPCLAILTFLAVLLRLFHSPSWSLSNCPRWSCCARNPRCRSRAVSRVVPFALFCFICHAAPRREWPPGAGSSARRPSG